MTRKAYKCSICGEVVARWVGQCPKCGEIGTMDDADISALNAQQAPVTKAGSRADRISSGDTPEPMNQISADSYARMKTGIGEFDRVLGGGIVPGGIMLLAAPPGSGKALALDTKLPTPEGWTTMEQVEVGDYLIDAEGKPTKVIATTNIMYSRPCYLITFSDGSTIVADEDHQWLTNTRTKNGGKGRTVKGHIHTTKEISESIFVYNEIRLNHSITVSEPLDLPEQKLIVPPYTLGAWLGDGTSSSAHIASADPQILDNIREEGIIVSKKSGPYNYYLGLPKKGATPKQEACVLCGKKLTSAERGRKTDFCLDHVNSESLQYKLREIGVLNNKHIPSNYLRGSYAQRKALLAGLLDTDGYISKTGHIVLALTSKTLIYDAYELVVSLGYKATIQTKRVKGAKEETSICYNLSLTTSDELFKLDRKNIRTVKTERTTQRQRYIKSVTKIESVPVKCVEVDNEDHLYLAGESMIPTHNSSLSLLVGSRLASDGKKVLIVSGEETKGQIKSRADRMGPISDNLYLLSEGNLNNVLGHIADLKPDFAIIDSIQTLLSDTSEGRVGSIGQVSEVAQQLTQLGKAMNIPMLLIGHVTKDGNIAGPRVVEHLVDVVLYLEDSRDNPLRLLRGVKNRYGATDEIGCFEHAEEGLTEVSDPSGFFLSQHAEGTVGFATSIIVEGNRALPIEVQALVTATNMPNPRRVNHGLDNARVLMIQAILEKHGGLRLSNKDIYVSTTGGLSTKDTSIDLAIAAAIVSSYKNQPTPEGSVFLGEATLTGEVRPPRNEKKRITEAERLGFAHVLTSSVDTSMNPARNIRQIYKLIDLLEKE